MAKEDTIKRLGDGWRGWWSSEQLRRVHTIDPAAAACYQLPNTPVTLLHPPWAVFFLSKAQLVVGELLRADFLLLAAPGDPVAHQWSPHLLSVITLYPLLVNLSQPSDKKYPFSVSYVPHFQSQCSIEKTSLCLQREQREIATEYAKQFCSIIFISLHFYRFRIIRKGMWGIYSNFIRFYIFRIIRKSNMGNEGSLPVDGVAFDAEEIKRLGKRFKKLVTSWITKANNVNFNKCCSWRIA